MPTTDTTTTDCADKGVVTISNCGTGAIITVCCDDAATDGSGAGDSEPSPTDDTPMTSDDSLQDEGWIGDAFFGAKCVCANGEYTLFAQWQADDGVKLSMNGELIYEGTNTSYQHYLGTKPTGNIELTLVGYGLSKAITLTPLDCGNCDGGALSLFVNCIESVVTWGWDGGTPDYTLTIDGLEVYSGDAKSFTMPDPIFPTTYDGVITDSEGLTSTVSIDTSLCQTCTPDGSIPDTTGLDTGQMVATEGTSALADVPNDYRSEMITDVVNIPAGATCIDAIRFKFKYQYRSWASRFTVPSPCTLENWSVGSFKSYPENYQSSNYGNVTVVSATVDTVSGKATIKWYRSGGHGTFGEPVCSALEGVRWG